MMLTAPRHLPDTILLVLLLILGTFVTQTVPDSQPSLPSYGSNLWASYMDKEQRIIEECRLKPEYHAAMSRQPQNKPKIFDNHDESEEQEARYPDDTTYRITRKAQGYTRVVGGWGRANPEKVDKDGEPEELPIDKHVSIAMGKKKYVLPIVFLMRIACMCIRNSRAVTLTVFHMSPLLV
jgi:hypothetical protein